ncbi:MAG: hypothetical protein CR982_08590 [Candidatus Cloacimonadota bacterium]|nr:MAG: hypothetical protein CR982_08590 [Candidatus Cloacimonadota bacterium]PIE78690.1 MAG: hypothetical protein CSA15_06515 [Candidatus Delongbacteria bacterium]
MDLKDRIKLYIKLNSSVAVRRRAKLITPTLEKRSDCQYVFQYLGSKNFLYLIIVDIGEEIETSCSCPYDYGGICKHQVAALNYILLECKNLLQKVEKSTEKEISKSKHLSILLPKHIIPEEELLNISSPDLYFSEIKSVDIDTRNIKTRYNKSSRSFIQNFNYDPETNRLKIDCNCYFYPNKCKHVSAGLSNIYRVFGRDFFHPNYLNTSIEKYIKQYGLTLDDDYSKYFELEVNTKGLSFIKKVENLHPVINLLKNNNLKKISQQEKDGSVLLNRVPKRNPTATHGVGICFNFFNIMGDKKLYFKPFVGKYKKNTTELSTYLKEVERDNLVEIIEDRTEKEKIFLLEAISMNNLTLKSSITYIKLEQFTEIFTKVKNFIDKNREIYPFFVEKSGGKLVKKNLKQIKFSDRDAELFFTVKEDSEFVTITPKIQIDKSYNINSKKIEITPFFCIENNKTLHFFRSSKDFFYLDSLNDETILRFLKNGKEDVIKNFIAPISEYFKIENRVCKTKRFKENGNIKKQLFLADYEGKYITFKLGVEYNGNLVLIHTSKQIIEGNKIIKRNKNLEEEFFEEFRELHPDFSEQEDIFFLEPLQLVQDEWLLKTTRRLKDKNIEIFGVKDLKSFKYNLNKPTISMSVNSNTDWFDLGIDISFGDQKVSLKDIKKNFLNKSKYVELKDGTLGLLPEKWLNKFSKYFKAGEVKDTEIKVSNYQFNIIDELYEDLNQKSDLLMELKKRKESLKNLQNITPVKIPKTVNAKLRHYQQEGLNWLVALQKYGLGGCLADDMGLGKTLQAIALLAYVKENNQSDLPNLIVAPTSLIFNWNKECEKFAPSLKVLTYTGMKRDELFNKMESQDIVITTYGIVLNDILKLQKKGFNYIILDESQAIKNPNSKRYKAVKLLNSKNRLTLTGTPIENNTFDLYSQMNFLNPGLLGTISHFRTEFSDMIDKSHNKETADLLHQIIYPFLLRRTKNQVATDLPQKTESIIYCEMGSDQRKIYEMFKSKYRKLLLNKFDEDGEAKSQIYVLEGLTKLRQICNSPHLLNEEEKYISSSVKLDILMEHIRTITSEGSKIVVFSQFTSMLALVQDRLNNEGIIFEYLDGQTRKREEKVKNFQEKDEVSLFLISLKAGGTGLNLTKAEYVFLIDPWWNPAVENQAIDRCYRIGQTKNVIAYRMICRDTIEEKIVDLQEGKKEVSDSIIQIDKEQKSFDRAKITELFG